MNPIRFNIDSYISKKKEISDDKFGKVVNNKKEILQNYFNDEKLQVILSNKSVAQMFLDKIIILKGSSHPDVAHAHNYMWGSCTFSSMELIRLLKGILDDPELPRESRQIIEQWIQTESEYLPLAILFDGWRASNQELLEFIL